MPFIDIHSHRQTDNKGTLTILNVLGSFQNIPSNGHYSAGMHPWYLKEDTATEEFNLLETAANDPNVLAIGECGLDKVCTNDWALQEIWFCRHIELANKLKKPLIIHCVRAFDEVLSKLAEKRIASPVIFHGFNKSKELAKSILDAGHHLSFGKHLLYDSGKELLAMIPADRFFLETDASGLSIVEIYREACAARQMEPDALDEQIHTNFAEVFRPELLK